MPENGIFGDILVVGQFAENYESINSSIMMKRKLCYILQHGSRSINLTADKTAVRPVRCNRQNS